MFLQRQTGHTSEQSKTALLSSLSIPFKLDDKVESDDADLPCLCKIYVQSPRPDWIHI
jgi:hypothetical protein